MIIDIGFSNALIIHMVSPVYSILVTSHNSNHNDISPSHDYHKTYKSQYTQENGIDVNSIY